ncbi:hypothetical protein GHK52_05395 [Lactococcus garvieae]|nr:hypothetical protein [Lactococcus garvieae]
MNAISKIIVGGVIFVSGNTNPTIVSASAVEIPKLGADKTGTEKPKPTDTIIELSSGIRVHGEITIYDMVNPDKPILSINTDHNSKAKILEEIEAGAGLDPIQVPDSKFISQFDILSLKTGDGNIPPTQLMRLGSGAYVRGHWTTGNYWHYAPYGYAPISGKALHFWAWSDSFLAGDSEDWRNTYNTGVGHGVYVHSIYEGSYPDIWVQAGVGQVLSCWSWGPKSGSNYEISNY